MNGTLDALGQKNTDNDLTDQSLYRKVEVLNPTSNFNVAEWLRYPINYCEGLGAMLATANIIVSNDFSFYPNPVTDVLSINGKEKIKNLEIFDLTGKSLIKIEHPKDTKIDVRRLNPGVYFLKVNQKILKLIKK